MRAAALSTYVYYAWTLKCLSCCFVSGFRAGRAHKQDHPAGGGQETQGGGGQHMAAQGESFDWGQTAVYSIYWGSVRGSAGYLQGLELD